MQIQEFSEESLMRNVSEEMEIARRNLKGTLIQLKCNQNAAFLLRSTLLRSESNELLGIHSSVVQNVLWNLLSFVAFSL